MTHSKTIFLFIIPIFIVSCSEDKGVNPSSGQAENYFGTYLYNDNECSNADVQYLTMESDGVSFFDYLGDNCDDTENCYSSQNFEIKVSSIDSLSIIPNNDSTYQNGVIHIISDSLILVSYKNGTSRFEHSWKKINDDIYSFTPLCDQQYEQTKDIADMMIYAVGDNGNLLWKNYIHGGIWDLASGVTPLSNGGYMVFGTLDAKERSGCCYTSDYEVRDFMKLDNEGQIEWKKEIKISEDGLSDDGYIGIGSSLFETSQGDMVFLAPGAPGNNKLVIIMINLNGDIIWRKNYSEEGLTYNSGNVEILESSNGNLVLAGGWNPGSLTFIDYISGDVISSISLPFGNARKIINIDGGFAIGGLGANDNGVLMKVDYQGGVVWSKLYDDPAASAPLDIISQNDGGYLIFCSSSPPPYATLIKTDSLGNEVWRKKYNDYIGGGKGWIHQTDDGGYFMASGYAVTKLDAQANLQWSAAAPSGFKKTFSNGTVSGINHDMKKINDGVIIVGYGSADWE